MIEKCYVMLKPGFAREEIVNRVITELEKEDMFLVDMAYIHYNEETARLHYIEKQIKPYVGELVDYLMSGEACGLVLEGDDAVNKCRARVEELRTELIEEFKLETDVMRNIIHCSSKTKVGDALLELDTQRELALFHYLKNRTIINM